MLKNVGENIKTILLHWSSITLWILGIKEYHFNPKFYLHFLPTLFMAI